MYSFRALIFVGIITLSTCRPETQSQIQQQELQQSKLNVLSRPCPPDLTSKQPFNATAYFRDVWYVVSAYDPDTPPNKNEGAMCLKITSQILENGHGKQIYTKFRGQSVTHIEWITKPEELQTGVGKFESRSVDKEGNPIDTLQPLRTIVIDTDYTNYAIEHKCLQDGSLAGYLIFNRKPNTVDPNVEPILTKLKLKLQDFTLMNNPVCEKA